MIAASFQAAMVLAAPAPIPKYPKSSAMISEWNGRIQRKRTNATHEMRGARTRPAVVGNLRAVVVTRLLPA